MRKQAAKLEWHIAESEAEWESQQALHLPEVALAVGHRLRLKSYFWTAMTVLLCLTGAGGWWRYSTQTSLPAAEAELRMAAEQKPLAAVTPDGDALVTTIMNERTNANWWLQPGGKNFDLRAPTQTDEPTGDESVVLHRIAFQGDQAMVSIIMAIPNGETMYRQARFYRRTPVGWRHASPEATLWEPDRSLETPYFIFHFGEQDRAVVLAVAPQMDALYTTLRRNFGLPIDFTLEKLVINVIVTQLPGQTSVFDAANQLSVASPALYFAPVELTDAELLAQAIALPLIEQVLAQASEQHAVAESWRPLLNGLRLWQVWNLEMPLAVWREEVVTWIYGGLPASRPGQAVVLPARYTALCAAHKLWLPSPTEIKIPLVCGKLAWEDFLLSPWGWYDPQTRLSQLVVPLRPEAYLDESASLHQAPYPSATVALATLIEYAVATYERDRLPALVAGLGQYDSWEILIPAVYGVSAAEFEAGWQAYLTAHYGVAAEHS